MNPIATHPLSFCAPLQRMIERKEAVGLDGNCHPVIVRSSLNNLLAIRSIILDRRPEKTLEIGLAHGTSTLAIMSTMAEVHGEDDWLHIGIDPFEISDWSGCAISAVRELDLEPHFAFWEEYSHVALVKLGKEYSASVDYVHVDGYHLFEHVFTDFFLSSFLLKPGGLITFDDCTDAHVAKVIRFIRKNCREMFRPINLGRHLEKTPLKQLANRLGYAQMKRFEKTAEFPRHYATAFRNF